MKSITRYAPMDINSWDKTGQGKNIMHLFNSLEKEIWVKAFPYQDKRNDVGHIEHVVYFVFKLLEYIRAERAIVVPAAILHDTGWGEVIPRLLSSWNPFSEDFKKNERKFRELHQEAGVKISEKILEEVGYQKQYIDTIIEIVSQHDTRNLFFCTEDGIVRDADKLWRFSLRHWEIYYSKIDPKDAYSRLLRAIKNSSFFSSNISRHIARAELEQTVKAIKVNFL